MAKKQTNRLVLAFALPFLLVGCLATGGTDRVVDTEDRQTRYNAFLDSTPDLQEQSVGNPAADLLFTGIQGLAVQQYEAFQAFSANMNDEDRVSLATRMENIRLEDGQDAYVAAVAELREAGGRDWEVYNEYMTLQEELTNARIQMIPEATRIVAGIAQLNPRDIAANPMAAVSAGRALNTAVAQGRYVTTSLQWMQEMNDSLRAAQEFQGR